MGNRMLFLILVPLTVAGMTALLSAEMVPPEKPAVIKLGDAFPTALGEDCEVCHYCDWDPEYALLGGGMSTAWTGPEPEEAAGGVSPDDLDQTPQFDPTDSEPVPDDDFGQSWDG